PRAAAVLAPTVPAVHRRASHAPTCHRHPRRSRGRTPQGPVRSTRYGRPMRAHRGREVAGLATATVLVATAFVSGAGVASGGVDGNVIELYSDGLTVTPEGVATVAPGTTQRYLPGTRVPDEPDAPAARRAAL